MSFTALRHVLGRHSPVEWVTNARALHRLHLAPVAGEIRSLSDPGLSLDLGVRRGQGSVGR
jgi:hypothetical protein